MSKIAFFRMLILAMLGASCLIPSQVTSGDDYNHLYHWQVLGDLDENGYQWRQHYECCFTICCETLSYKSGKSSSPIQVALINLTVTLMCKVPIQIGGYKD